MHIQRLLGYQNTEYIAGESIIDNIIAWHEKSAYRFRQTLCVNIMLSQQPLDQIEGLNAIVGRIQTGIHRQNDFLIIVANLLQGRQFTAADIFTDHGFCHLDIQLLIRFGGDEVNFGSIHLADGNIIASAEQFKIDNVFDCMAAVTVAEAKQIVPQPHVHDIEFTEGSQILLALNIESLDIIEEKGFHQCGDIGLHSMGAGNALALSVFQQSFIYQRVSDGRNGNSAADIVGQEEYVAC